MTIPQEIDYLFEYHQNLVSMLRSGTKSQVLADSDAPSGLRCEVLTTDAKDIGRLYAEKQRVKDRLVSLQITYNNNSHNE